MCSLRQALAVPHARALPIRVVPRVAITIMWVVRVRLRVPGRGAGGGLQVLVLLLLLLVRLVSRGLGGRGWVGRSAGCAPEDSRQEVADSHTRWHARCSACWSPQ